MNLSNSENGTDQKEPKNNTWKWIVLFAVIHMFTGGFRNPGDIAEKGLTAAVALFIIFIVYWLFKKITK